jgi:anti-sigma factor RsiW
MTIPDNLLVHAYVDGELDPAHTLELEGAIAADPALAAERDRAQALRDLIRDRLSSERAPAGLLSRIEFAVGMRRGRMRPSSRPSWGALAAAVMIAAVMGSSSTWLMYRPPPPDTTAEMVVASHLRALMAPQPIDVSSSDRHTVKPWFNGRIPESPRVVDLTSEGFPLVGGRIDVIDRTPVPTLVYRHRQHLISLMAIPAAAANMPERQTIAGYNIIEWSDNGVRYWAVSDLGAVDLESFAKAFREAIPDG